MRSLMHAAQYNLPPALPSMHLRPEDGISPSACTAIALRALHVMVLDGGSISTPGDVERVLLEGACDWQHAHAAAAGAAGEGKAMEHLTAEQVG